MFLFSLTRARCPGDHYVAIVTQLAEDGVNADDLLTHRHSVSQTVRGPGLLSSRNLLKVTSAPG